MMYGRHRGYSIVELIMAMFAGSLLMAGAYQGFSILSKQYDAVRSAADIEQSGVIVSDFLASEFRKAGRLAYNDEGQAPSGAIDTPIFIESDPNHACCDIVTMMYDIDTQTRAEARYYVSKRTNPETRLALYMDTDIIQDGVRTTQASEAFVADYIEAFQIDILQTNNAGDPLTLNIETVFRAKQRHMFKQDFTIPPYASAVTDYTAPDTLFERRFFKKKVMLRNLEKF